MDIPLNIALGLSKFEDAKKRLGAKQTQIDELEQRVENIKKAKEVLRKLVEVSTEASIEQLNSLVTSGLQDIFYDQDISFTARSYIQYGTPKLDMVFIIDGEERSPSMVGGGVIGVASVVLRIVEAKLFGLAKILLLDEPLVHVSEKYLPKAAEFVKELAGRMEFDILMVSHQKALASGADVVLEASLTKEGLVIEQV